MKKDKATSPVYTAIDCGIPNRGLNFLGFMAPAEARRQARKHYEEELARCSAALEQLAHGDVGISYRHCGTLVDAQYAAAQQGLNNQAAQKQLRTEAKRGRKKASAGA